MTTSKRFLWIGFTAVFIAVVSAIVLVGPKKLIAAALSSAMNDTAYAPGFSETVFNEIQIGDTEAVVLSKLGAPFFTRKVEAYSQTLYATTPFSEFEKIGISPGEADYTVFIYAPDSKLQSAHGQIFMGKSGGGLMSTEITMRFGDGQNFLGIKDAEIAKLKVSGATRVEIEKRYGPPVNEMKSDVVRWLIYSNSPSGGSYLLRWIGLDEAGNVSKIRSEQYVD